MSSIPVPGTLAYTFHAEAVALPVQPGGFRVLLRMPPPKEKTKSGLHLPEASAKRENVAVMVAEVVAMGPDCYKNEFFTSGPWCKVGDWVMLSSYAGQRFLFRDREYRLLADQDILGVTEVPMELEHT